MVKKYEPEVTHSFSMYDEDDDFKVTMEPCSHGTWVSLSDHNKTVKLLNDMHTKFNKLQKEFDELKKAQNG